MCRSCLGSFLPLFFPPDFGMLLISCSGSFRPSSLSVLPHMRPSPPLHPMSVSFLFFPSSRCERVACKLTQDPASCLSLPLRISFYNISFPINVPVPADIFQMGHSTSSRKDKFELAIVSGNEEGYFGVEYRARRGHIILRRPLFEARDFSLTVELRLSRSGKTRLYVAKIAVFATNGLSTNP